jgi:hypothetical protein
VGTSDLITVNNLRREVKRSTGKLGEVRGKKSPIACILRHQRSFSSLWGSSGLRLKLPGFDRAKPQFERFVEGQSSYKTNTYPPLEPPLQDKIRKRWGFMFDAFV